MRTNKFIHGCKFLNGSVSSQDCLTVVFGTSHEDEQELAIFGASNLEGLQSLRDALDVLIAGQNARDAAEAEFGPTMASLPLNTDQSHE
jgi:hypothetical protein